MELSTCEHLRTFTFTDNFNTTGFEEGWKIIFEFLKNNKTIRFLSLSMSFLYDKYILELFTKTLTYKKIVKLDLSSNFITYQGAKKISQWIEKNKTLKLLNLQQNTMNEFKKEGADLICSSLSNHNRIQSLDLSFMILTGIGEKLSLLISSTKTLKELKIQNCRINLDDYKFMCQSLAENETIVDLNIAENNCSSDKAIEYLAGFIAKNKKVEILRIDNLGITMKNSSLLFENIKLNTTIKNYNLSENPKLKFKIIYETFLEMKNVEVITFTQTGQNYSSGNFGYGNTSSSMGGISSNNLNNVSSNKDIRDLSRSNLLANTNITNYTNSSPNNSKFNKEEDELINKFRSERPDVVLNLSL